jgi:DNA-binding transcriptional LysR family regulator
MTLRHLRAFMAVAEELSFTGAARKLHISQPPLSRQIQQLEKEVGVKLFLRRSHGIELTDRGRSFLADARRLNGIANDFLQTAQRLRRDGTGSVRVGTGWGLWKAINRLRLQHVRRDAGVEIIVEDLVNRREHQNPADALRRQQIDIALTRVPVDAPSIECEVAFHEQIVVLLRESHPLSGARAVRLRQLAEETLLMPDRQVAPVLFDRVLALYAAAGVIPRVVHTRSTPDALSGLLQVASGEGIHLTAASPWTQPHAVNGVAEVPLDEPNATTPMFLAWRREEKSRNVLNLVASARDVFRS